MKTFRNYTQAPQVLSPDVDRQRKMADMLRQQSAQPMQGQMVSGHYIAPSFADGVNKLFSGYASGKLEGMANDREQEQRNALSSALRTPEMPPEGIRAPGYQTPALTDRLAALQDNPQAQQLAMQLRLNEATREEQPRLQTMSGTAYGFPEGTTVQVNPQTGQVTPLYEPEAPDFNKPIIMGPNGQPMPNHAYIDAQSQIRAAGKSPPVSIDFGGMMGGAPELGKLSTDFGYVLDPETRQPVIDESTGLPISSVVPGSKTYNEMKAAEAAAESAADSDTTAKAERSNVILTSVSSIKDIMESAETPVTGTFSKPFAMVSSSPAGKVRAYVSTLQSGVAMGGLLALKEASSTGASGLGALNEKELDLLISELGSLDPDNADPEIFMQTLDRVEQRYSRIADNIKKNVSPDKIRELGLDSIIDSYGGNQGQPEQSGLNDQERQELEQLRRELNGG